MIVVNTIYEKYEAIIWRKYSRQLAAEGIIDPRIEGELGTIVCYEMIRCLYNQPCSRYPLEALDPGLDSISSGFLRRVCDNISVIARLALDYPEDCHKLKGYGAINYIFCAMKLAHDYNKEDFRLPASIDEIDKLASLDDWDSYKFTEVPSDIFQQWLTEVIRHAALVSDKCNMDDQQVQCSEVLLQLSDGAMAQTSPLTCDDLQVSPLRLARRRH
ncbi:hypothetical protein GQX73_g3834 [Xylaria multiplex]|uniref:Uncharacterized protein n=1 Tax=Xylaria multiplex TaxID=323545 RepID=A0A7C8J306_9PEZI|nr:hypothetical protein GQX73_g3834 [Xylaria multiplex]